MMQDENSSTLARNWTNAYCLFDLIDTVKTIVVVSNYVVFAEVTIQLNCVETVKTRIGSDGVNYEKEIVGKLFDFRVVTIGAAVLNSQGVELEYVQKYLDRRPH